MDASVKMDGEDLDERSLAALDASVCEWKSGDDGDPLDFCEDGKHFIPKGEAIYFLSDGGYDAREGTYFCRACAERLITQNNADALLSDENGHQGARSGGA